MAESTVVIDIKTLDNSTRELKNISASMGNVGRSAKTMGSEASSASGRGGLGGLQGVLPGIGGLLEQVGGSIGNLGGMFSSFGSSAGAAGSAASSAGGAMGTMGLIAGGAAAMGIGILIQKAQEGVEQFKQLSSKIVQFVREAVNLSGLQELELMDWASIDPMVHENIDLFNKATDDMAVRWGVAREELAKGGYALSSLGFTANESAEDVLRFMDSVAETAAGLRMGFPETVQTIGALMKAYGVELEEVDDITAKFRKGVEMSALSGEEMNVALGELGERAYAAGININELMASISTMSNTGMKAAKVGTSLYSSFSNLIAPTPEAMSAIDGLNQAMGTNIDLSASAIKQKGMVPMLEEIKAAYMGMGNSVMQINGIQLNRDSLMQKIFGGEQGAGAIITMINHLDEYKASLQSINDTTIDSLGHSLNLDTWSVAMVQLKEAIRSLKEEFGDNFKVTLEPLVRMLTEIIGKVTEFLDQNPMIKEMLVSFMKGVMIVTASLMMLSVTFNPVLNVLLALSWIAGNAHTSLRMLFEQFAKAKNADGWFSNLLKAFKNIWDWLVKIFSYTPTGAVGKWILGKLGLGGKKDEPTGAAKEEKPQRDVGNLRNPTIQSGESQLLDPFGEVAGQLDKDQAKQQKEQQQMMQQAMAEWSKQMQQYGEQQSMVQNWDSSMQKAYDDWTKYAEDNKQGFSMDQVAQTAETYRYYEERNKAINNAPMEQERALTEQERTIREAWSSWADSMRQYGEDQALVQNWDSSAKKAWTDWVSYAQDKQQGFSMDQVADTAKTYRYYEERNKAINSGQYASASAYGTDNRLYGVGGREGTYQAGKVYGEIYIYAPQGMNVSSNFNEGVRGYTQPSGMAPPARTKRAFN